MTGTATAAEVNHPLGQYLYTIEISWDTGVQQAQSHLDVLLDIDVEACVCICEFSFGVEDTTGVSDGTLDGECLVYYHAEFLCEGDPSVGGVDGPLVKFEPYPSDCEPGAIGSGTFWFYSDWPPVEIETPNDLLVMKFDSDQCSGELSGFLPGCIDCDATPVESTTWGKIKSIYE
jgi:hypothetical protein